MREQKRRGIVILKAWVKAELALRAGGFPVFPGTNEALPPAIIAELERLLREE